VRENKPNPLKLSFQTQNADVSGFLNDEKPKAQISGLEKWLLRKLIKQIGDPPLRIVMWDGRELAEP
jgi:hypothetical protein